ncbi:MAG: hypothetical protein ACRD36_11545 [Candidatus Acidiferrum sp.]
MFNKRSAMRRVGSSRLSFLAAMNDQPSLDEFKDYIPGPYLTAIGKVCANWGILKAAMDLAIAKLAGFNLQDSRGVILVAHISWPLKMDILEAPVNGLLRDYPNSPHSKRRNHF